MVKVAQDAMDKSKKLHRTRREIKYMESFHPETYNIYFKDRNFKFFSTRGKYAHRRFL
jgi:hypothetical protein